MKAQDYFNAAASTYDDERTQGFASCLVKQEFSLVKSFLPELTNKQVLDAGAGTGLYAAFVKKLGAHVLALDISENMIRLLRKKNIHALRGDIETFSLKKRFDVILCSGPLEFIEHQDRALENLSKHLKKGGMLIIIYPRRSLGGWAYYLYHLLVHHIRITILSRSILTHLLTTLGFSNLTFKNATPLSYVIQAIKG